MTEPVNDGDVPDADERLRALDVDRSFIVQAPAGSGKTELLIQRYLALLARVESPEEVVAVTFTRKASAEMRARVLHALDLAADDTPPPQAHRLQTWRLARAVRARDAAMNWGLRGSPSRLRLQTIDSLCASLTRQMPVLSGFGAQPESLENAAELHQEAARRTLALIDAGGAGAAEVERLLTHLDNELPRIESLLAGMLDKRDQWLRHVGSGSREVDRETLERALAGWVEDHLTDLIAAVPDRIEEALCRIVRDAAANLVAQNIRSDLTRLADLIRLPDASVSSVGAWRVLAGLLLTQKGEPRKAFNAKDGFLAPSNTKDPVEKLRRSALKQDMEALVAKAAGYPGFIDLLQGARALPPETYTDAQWAVLSALVHLLPVAVAQLTLVFRERRQVDFTAIAQAAVAALGPEDEPTDLALALDYRIRHLLVDEFQDTSQSQYDLLTRLTAGWEPDDGRTLFVVGDPMQSIYRFREAEVGLYLRARGRGIGTVHLDALTLKVNFRSQGGIVDWLNDTFGQVLPAREDIAAGAVPHAASVAIHAGLDGDAVAVHPQLANDPEAEAVEVAAVVRHALAADPDHKVAILVRARSHLTAIVPALKAIGLRPQAIDVEALGERPAIQDLRALTRALLHPADRLAWLAVLRAPWCGLTLADLEQLAGSDRHAAIPYLLASADRLARLSTDGRARATTLRDRLKPVIAQRRRAPLRRWIEHAWLAIGGPATADGPAALDDADVYFELLDEVGEAGDLLDFAALDAQLDTLYAHPDPEADPRLLVMTMHKAKGLEFDVVILPRLGTRSRGSDAELLLWLERPRGHGAIDLVLAPISDRAGADKTMYEAVRDLDRRKDTHEVVRLVYVAATRAKSRLHLFGHVTVKDGEPRVAAGSLLKVLWPVVEAGFAEAISLRQSATITDVDDEEVDAVAPTIRRFAMPWQPPLPAPAVSVSTDTVPAVGGETVQVEFSWASETAKHIGTVVHRWLQTMAEEGLDGWTVERIAGLRSVFERDLLVLGVPESARAAALPRVVDALTTSLGDERARWILSAHTDAQNELRLTSVLDGVVTHIAIDRTFVDAAGTRWIIDYKTGIREGADREGFLDNEQQRYREQLDRYAAAMAGIDARPIRLALYFPLMKGWREWEAAQPGR